MNAVLLFLFVFHQYRSSFHMSRAVTSQQTWGMCGSDGIHKPDTADTEENAIELVFNVDEQARLDGARMPKYVSARGVHHPTQQKLHNALKGILNSTNTSKNTGASFSMSPRHQFYATRRADRRKYKPKKKAVRSGRNVNACLGHRSTLSEQRRFLNAHDRHLSRVNTILTKK